MIPLGPTSRDRAGQVARVAVRVPDPTFSLEECQRWAHADLAAMSRADLLLEMGRLRVFLCFADRPAEWHLERLHAVREALRRV